MPSAYKIVVQGFFTQIFWSIVYLPIKGEVWKKQERVGKTVRYVRHKSFIMKLLSPNYKSIIF